MECPQDKKDKYPNCKHRLGKTIHFNPDGTRTLITEKEECALQKCKPEEVPQIA